MPVIKSPQFGFHRIIIGLLPEKFRRNQKNQAKALKTELTTELVRKGRVRAPFLKRVN